VIWSPSRTQQWLKCPRFWELACAGAEERRERGWTPAMIAGTAVHAGFASLMKREGITDALTAAGESLNENWPQECGDWDFSTVRNKVDKAVMKLVDVPDELLADDGWPVSIEEQLDGTEEDRKRGTYQGTPDLITEHGEADGRYLCVTDLKTHWTLDDVYVERDQNDTRHSWQMYQYAWFGQEKYGKPVRAIRKVTVRLSPAPKVWTFTWPVRTEDLEQWHRSAQVVWEGMNTADVWENWTNCRTSFGRCGFYHVCH